MTSSCVVRVGLGNMRGNLGALATAGFRPWVFKHWDMSHVCHAPLLVCAARFVMAGVASLGNDARVSLGLEKAVDQPT